MKKSILVLAVLLSLTGIVGCASRLTHEKVLLIEILNRIFKKYAIAAYKYKK